MTALKDQIRAQMTGAMKQGDKISVGALRMLMAAITNREKEVLHDLSDEEIAEVAGKEVKKRGESIEAFDAAGRTELAEKERAERDVLAPFAPEQMSDTELDAIIQEALASSGATNSKEMGKVMGLVMARAKGRVDGTVVQQKVRALLGE
jgi:uncharacterized protein YqeY